MWKLANFHVVFVWYWLYRAGDGTGELKYLSQMYLEDILSLPKFLHVSLWNYPYITMWKPANFHMVFECKWLHRAGDGSGDLKYL
jgi:hypothetical protein